MKRNIVWSARAKNAYAEIIAFIAKDNRAAAERVRRRINIQVSSLEAFATGRPGRVAGIYEKPIPGLPYILAYEIIRMANAREVIAIIDLIHTARNWPEGSWPA